MVSVCVLSDTVKKVWPVFVCPVSHSEKGVASVCVSCQLLRKRCGLCVYVLSVTVKKGVASVCVLSVTVKMAWPLCVYPVSHSEKGVASVCPVSHSERDMASVCPSEGGMLYVFVLSLTVKKAWPLYVLSLTMKEV